MKKPTFFISSTIYDFSDLRSGIKYYLESQGCKVLASEYNDFEKPLDKHSYDACLESIKQADYFILLIGTRVGGWYDENNRISITRKEYREAYNLQEETGIKIINFIREEVWQYRDINKELEKYLKNNDINSDSKKGILERKSKYSDDANFINNFINEVGKNNETKEVIKDGGALPKSNWIHTFSDFGDIIQVLSTLSFLTLPVEEKLLQDLLKNELVNILSVFLIKLNGKIFSPKNSINNFIEKYQIFITKSGNNLTTVNFEDWRHLHNTSIFILAKNFKAIVLEKVLSDPIFAEFDRETGQFQFNETFHASYELKKQLDRFKLLDTPKTREIAYEHTPKFYYPNYPATIDLPSTKLASLIALLNVWINIIELCKSLISHFEGRKFAMPELQPLSPIFGFSEEIEKEIITPNEVLEFINQNEN